MNAPFVFGESVAVEHQAVSAPYSPALLRSFARLALEAVQRVLTPGDTESMLLSISRRPEVDNLRGSGQSEHAIMPAATRRPVLSSVHHRGGCVAPITL